MRIDTLVTEILSAAFQVPPRGEASLQASFTITFVEAFYREDRETFHLVKDPRLVIRDLRCLLLLNITAHTTHSPPPPPPDSDSTTCYLYSTENICLFVNWYMDFNETEGRRVPRTKKKGKATHYCPMNTITKKFNDNNILDVSNSKKIPYTQFFLSNKIFCDLQNRRRYMRLKVRKITHEV